MAIPGVDNGLLVPSSAKKRQSIRRADRAARDQDRRLIERTNGLGETSFMTTLAALIREEGYNWCEACQLFALHDDKLPANGTLADRYAVCACRPSSTGSARDPIAESDFVQLHHVRGR